MALYKYFRPCKKATSSMSLPDPDGPLSKEVDTETTRQMLAVSWGEPEARQHAIVFSCFVP